MTEPWHSCAERAPNICAQARTFQLGNLTREPRTRPHIWRQLLTDPDAVASLLDSLLALGAEEQVAALLSRNLPYT